MAKQLNVKLNFDADTSRAKQQIQDLQMALSKVLATPTSKLGATISGDIEGAIKSVAELQAHLTKATNVDTGKLDFTKLNQSISKSGKTLESYGKQLLGLGPAGQQAFAQLAQSVASAEIPIFRVSSKLKELGTTLANTARWQLSSSIMHGFMGAIQGAYGYAQDLNESLNNIRIVTGQNIDEMAKFAKEANKAAKALSTTTTNYTNASLIYYQQGLSDQEVKERTDITVKMANVARESAETVSDQMTAVWNNFYDGSKSLEYYADVMTALGAATASSTAEISEGLNKFAAVAETVGLSYEYATAALATVTATTRQSADVVGTAFKTLFARVQDLELGKTLDDGTTLGSYSQALEKVGIDIMDTSGNLKQMDAILEEMAARWDTLGKAEQTALAQNVAGVRQYTQLIALMDNWDFMRENLSTAAGATGALQAQAEIYAESWEAAQDRVRAAAEKIYDSLINDEFFIDLLNSVEDVLTFVDKLIDSVGGLNGVLTALGVVITKIFSDKLSSGLQSMAISMQTMTAAGRQKYADKQKSFIENTLNELRDNRDSEKPTVLDTARQDQIKAELQLQQQLLINKDKMSDIEFEINQKLLEHSRILHGLAIKAAEEEKAKFDILESSDTGSTLSKQINQALYGDKNKGLIANFIQNSDLDQKLKEEFDNAAEGSEEYYKVLIKIGRKLHEIALADLETDEEIEDRIKNTTDEAEKKQLRAEKETNKAIRERIGQEEELYEAHYKRARAVQEAAASDEKASKSITILTNRQKDWSDIIAESFELVMSGLSVFNMLKSLTDTITNPDVSGWEKFTSVMMTLGMLIPTLINTWKSFKSVINLETIAKIANTVATWSQVAAEKKLGETKSKNLQTTTDNATATAKETISKAINTIGKNTLKTQNGSAQFREIRGKSGNYYQYNKKGNIIRDAYGPKMLSEADLTKIIIGKMGVAAAGAALAIASIATAITITVKAYKRYETAAKKAEAAAIANAKAHETVKQNYNDFKNLTDDYSSGVKGLQELTKGTLEYNEALLAANQSAMDLIKSNTALQYHVEDGLIVIDNLADIQQKELQKLSASQASLIVSENVKNEVRATSDKVNLTRKIDSDSDNLGAIGGQLGWGAAGVATGIGTALALGFLMSNPAGWAILAGLATTAIGGGITAAQGVSTKQERNTLDDIAAYVRANGQNSIFVDDTIFEEFLIKDLQLDDKDLIKSLVENRQAVEDLTNTEILRLNQEIDNAKIAYAAYNASNVRYTNSDIKSYLDSKFIALKQDKEKRNAVQKTVANLRDGTNKDFWEEWLVYVKGEDRNSLTTDQANEIYGDNFRVSNIAGGHATIWTKGETGWVKASDKNDYSNDVAAKELEEYMLMKQAADMIGISEVEYSQRAQEFKKGTNKDLITTLLSAEAEDKLTADLSAFSYTELQYIKGLKTTNAEFDKLIESSYQAAVGKQEEILDKIPGLKDKLINNGLLDIYFTLHFDEKDTEEEILKAISQAQDIANSNSIYLTLSATKELEDLLAKENKTEEDWKNIKEQYDVLKAQNPNLVDWDEFLTYDQQKQQDYINKVKRQTRDNGVIKTADQGIEAAKSGIIKAKGAVTTAKGEVGEAETALTKAINAEPLSAEAQQTALAYLKGKLNSQELAVLKNDPEKLQQVLEQINKIVQFTGEDKNQLYEDLMAIIGIDYGDGKALRGAGLTAVNWYAGAVNPSSANKKKFGSDYGFGSYIDQLTENIIADSEYNENVQNAKADLDTAQAQLAEAEGNLQKSENELSNQYKQRQKNIDTLEANIIKLGYSAEETVGLIQYLKTQYKDEDFVYDLAEALAKAKKGYTAFGTSLNDWLDKFNSKDPITIANVLNQIYNALAQILDLEPDKLKKWFDEDWLKSEEGQQVLQQLTDKDQSNDDEAYTTLIERYADKAGLDKNTLPLLFNQGIENIANRTKNYESGDKMDSGLQDILASYLFRGKLTPDQVEDIAGLMGFELTTYQDNEGKYRIQDTSYIGTNANFETAENEEPYQNERYKPEDYRIARAEENINKAYGNALVGTYNTAYERYRAKNETAQEWYKTDSEALEKLLGEDNLKGLLNADGTINLNNLMAKYDSIYNTLDNAQKESFDKAVDQLLETNEVIIETSEQMKDALFNKFMKGLENQLEANDNRLSEIELALSAYGDDIENAAERLSLIFNNDPNSLSQWEVYADDINEYQTALRDLGNAYANGKIDQAQYAEGLQKIKEGSAASAKDLIELNNQMRTYYEDVLSKGKQELADYTDHMEHVTEATEHYKNVLGLIGKLGLKEETDTYAESMRKLNKYTRTSIKNRKEVAEEYYKGLAGQVEYWNTMVNQDGLTNEQKKFYEEQRDAAIDAADEAQKELFSLTESWLEAEKALVEFELEELAKDLEKYLTGTYGTFEDLLDQFDKLNTRQEEYLTETNKMYETNKMMAEANKLLDETTNKAAKQKIFNFVNETKKLQENTQLSEFELELQQAKYDLLLAEIALEEARGAKSTVRLTRDNEGNFGYVYTADQEAIFDAEQKVAEAENKLYNKSLDGQQKYQEQYFKAAQSMFQELTELETAYLNGEIESKEAYELKKQEITEHYYGENGILRTYSNLYNIAVQANADATADNWFNNYDRMGKDADAFGLDLDELKTKTNEYLKDVGDKTTEYKEIANNAYQEVKDAINSVVGGDKEDGGLTKLISESDTLLHQITDKNGLLDALNDETTQVSDLATAYGNVIANVQGLINTAKGINSDVIGKLNTLLDPTGNPEMDGTTPPPSINPGAGEGEDGNESGGKNKYTGSYQPTGEIYVVQDGDTLWGIGLKNQSKGISPEKNYNNWLEWIKYNQDNGWIGDNPNDIHGGQTLRFNTGGYTGAWGSEGRWALLDEKELVLNSSDTENILRTVSFVRELASLIDSQASMSNISGFFSSPGIGNHNSTLEQNVEIHAEFPNATDRYEIEEAFNSLVNRASQYANRK